MGEVVLATRPEYGKGADVFSACPLDVRPAPADEVSLAGAVAAAPGCRAVIVGTETYTGPLYQALGERARGAGAMPGAIIARFGVGCDGVDVEQCRRRGIVVANTPGVLDASVAELTAALILAAARRVAETDRAVRDGAWPAAGGVELVGRTLAVFGPGGIGRRVARIAKAGLGMRVIGVGRRPVDRLAADEGIPADALADRLGVDAYTTDADAALGDADVVSLHLPGGRDTKGFMDAGRLGRMKTGAILVNTARGSVVCEDALYEALAAGRLGAAGLDVFASEPYRPASHDRDLRRLDNVVLTPHVGSCTDAANRRMASACAANVRAFVSGRLAGVSRVPGSA